MGMKRMVLGKTGIEAARLGFGGIPIQRVSETQAIAAVLYSLEKGWILSIPRGCIPTAKPKSEKP
jgi:hypothetical protein